MLAFAVPHNGLTSRVRWVTMQDHAEKSVRHMLRAFSEDHGLKEVDTVSAEDQMDDGSAIRLAVTINRKEGSAVFDFEGAQAALISASVVVHCSLHHANFWRSVLDI